MLRTGMINLLLAVWLGWDAVAGALGYRLYYGPEPGVQTVSEDTGEKTTWEVTGLPVEVPIYFVVRAYNSVGESGPSNEVVWIEPKPRGNSGKPPK
jgi:hypothetical protein